QNTAEKTVVIVFDLLQSSYVKYIIGFPQPFQYQGKSVTGANIYVVPNVDLDEFIQYVQQNNLQYTTDYTPFFESLSNVSNRISDPEKMLIYLKTNHIRYLLLARLRVDPTQNTGRYINTTHRYLWYISTKYQNLFKIIHVEGKEEPCEIVEFIN
ncbi:MAG: hypothetical protein LBE56_09295, partial [Tannerella sp.]|nr:hypothetical protein [Tannerella sp.]